MLVVVIRGFSAAIVVFLATKGGIAVFTDGSTAEPNPYVLFFTCLLGAVFSERIWDWAKTQIASKYPTDVDTNDVKNKTGEKEMTKNDTAEAGDSNATVPNDPDVSEGGKRDKNE